MCQSNDLAERANLTATRTIHRAAIVSTIASITRRRRIGAGGSKDVPRDVGVRGKRKKGGRMVEKEVAKAIEALLQERRTFEPPEDFAEQANLNDAAVYETASEDPDGWWASQAERLDWFEKWDTVLEWKPPHQKWFLGGKLNAAHNCVDRHAAAVPDRVAYHWIGEPDDETRTITYKDLYEEVCRLANVLVDLGVRKGDRVAIYMPMIPELPAAMLACARIGAAHSVVFGGFSAESLRDRINDAECKVLITADGGYRRGQDRRVEEGRGRSPSKHAVH